MSLNLDKSTWTRVAFGDVVNNVNQTVRDAKAAGIDRIIAMEHMDPGELKIQRWGDAERGTTFTRRVTPGQTLFGKRRAYQRKVAYAEFEAICSGDIYTFEAKETQLLPEFLPFLVQSNEFFDHALETSAGSLSPRTNWRDLANFEFGLPPLDEQKRLANLLWVGEACRRALLGELEALTSVQSEWFQRALLTGSGNRAWPRRAVPDLLRAGPTNGKSATANDEQRGIPTLSISAIRDGRVLGGASVKYMDVDPGTVEKFVIQPEDFLVVRGNGNKQQTGRGGLATDDLPDGCVYPDLLIRLQFNREIVLPVFAGAQWNAPVAHAALLRKAKSTNGIWKINGKDIKSHELVVPPLDEQKRIMAIVGSAREAAEALRTEADLVGEIRASWLAEMFRGN